MMDLNLFSPDYATARRRFRQLVDQGDWQRESHPIAARGPEQGSEQDAEQVPAQAPDQGPDQGPDEAPLTIDVAWSRGGDPERVLVISSGVHGVEAFFGSAVQLALLRQWGDRPPEAGPKILLLHGVNPYGFAWLRRFDEHGVDLNRNFLLPGQPYTGAPEAYARLDSLLNPRRPPSRREPFTLKALAAVARYGMPRLRQAVAGGQYEFPQGLFYGGAGPSESHRLLRENLGRWLQGSRHVVHLDYHTGLGARGTWKLLIDYSLSDRQRARLDDWFGAGAYEAEDGRNVGYGTRGGFGQWCVGQAFAPDYLYACAEFGTYGPIRVLAGLRAENQAHHWGQPAERATIWAKQRLLELFCPRATAWRTRVLEEGLRLATRSLRGLREL